MSVILEIYYRAPEDPEREKRILAEVVKMGGTLNFKEQSASDASRAICLTFEFSDREAANEVAKTIRLLGEHVEGPSDYD